MLVEQKFILNKPITLILCIGWIILLSVFEYIVLSKGNYMAGLGGAIAIIILLMLVMGTSITFFESFLTVQNYYFVKRNIEYKNISQIAIISNTTFSMHGYHKIKLIQLHMNDDNVKPMVISHYNTATANKIMETLKNKAPQAVWL
jgi:hypothetical protein